MNKIQKMLICASAVVVSTVAFSVTASADISGKAGIAFQTNTTWNYRNPYNGSTKDATSFPNKGVGVQGGGYGSDNTVAAKDVKISGNGTYTVSIPCSGVIDTDIQKYADGTFRSGDALNWSMSCNYEESDEGVLKGKVTDKFNFLMISTNIAVDDITGDDGSENGVVNGKTVTCTDVKATIGGKVYTLKAAPQKSDEDYLCWQLINTYNNKMTGITPAVIPEDGNIEITFTVKGLDSTYKLSSKSVSVETSHASYTYTGKEIKPAATVKYGKTTLKKGTDYTVSYKNNKAFGKATIVIKGKGNYSGTITKTFKITPKKQVAKVTAKTKAVKVSWTKYSKASGYEIQYATKSNMSGKKIVKASKTSTSKTITKLSAKKNYYVRVRTYKTVNGVKYYGSWSKVLKVKTK